MDGVETQEFEFVAVKHEAEDNQGEPTSAAAQEFEFVAVKEEELEDEKLRTQQEQLNLLETSPYSTQLAHSGCEVTTTPPIADSPHTQSTEQATPSTDPENGGRRRGGSSPEEGITLSGALEGDGEECSGVAFRCDSCPEVFSSKYDITRHVFDHVDGVPPPCHICRLCGEVFTNSLCLIEHVLILGARGKLCAADRDVRQRDGLTGREWLSDICRKVHRLEHGEGRPRPPGGAAEPCQCAICRNLLSHWKHKRWERLHGVSFCGKCYTRCDGLNLHVCGRVRETPFACDLCEKTFTLYDALKRHRRWHREECLHVCEICGKSFRRKQYYVVHKRIHSVERPHVCSYCGRAFTRFYTLQQHLHIHTGERPYSCEVCDSKFRQYATLYRHMRTHVGESSRS